MPSRPNKPCSKCGRLTPGGNRLCASCLTAERKRTDAARSGPRMRGGWDTAQWRALRAAVLQRDPACRICGKAPSTCADHILAVKLGGAPFDMANLQGACRACNSAKARDEGSFGRPPRKER
jgi:5-methylcytosine-specific restriction endonuclease McrA